jgi:hypothetical protein
VGGPALLGWHYRLLHPTAATFATLLPPSQGADGAAASTKKKRPRGGPAAGYEGEDILLGGAPDGPLRLQLPVRFAEGTWMAAAWRVLAGVGPEGMKISDVSDILKSTIFMPFFF